MDRYSWVERHHSFPGEPPAGLVHTDENAILVQTKVDSALACFWRVDSRFCNGPAGRGVLEPEVKRFYGIQERNLVGVSGHDDVK